MSDEIERYNMQTTFGNTELERSFDEERLKKRISQLNRKFPNYGSRTIMKFLANEGWNISERDYNNCCD